MLKSVEKNASAIYLIKINELIEKMNPFVVVIQKILSRFIGITKQYEDFRMKAWIDDEERERKRERKGRGI